MGATLTRVLVGLLALAIMPWALGAIVNAVHHSALLSLFVAGVLMLVLSVALAYFALRRR